MKSITFILTPLLLSIGLNAQTISSGSTAQQYSKPGAPIDMKFTSQKVDVNEISDVNITLTTTVYKGTISTLISLDKDLNSLTELNKNLTFEVLPEQQNFSINLQVKSKKQGLYYIKLLTKVDKGYGIKLRSFAVPVYIGESVGIISKNLNPQMKALGLGENISISKAIETIEIVKE